MENLGGGLEPVEGCDSISQHEETFTDNVLRRADGCMEHEKLMMLNGTDRVWLRQARALDLGITYSWVGITISTSR